MAVLYRRVKCVPDLLFEFQTASLRLEARCSVACHHMGMICSLKLSTAAHSCWYPEPAPPDADLLVRLKFSDTAKHFISGLNWDEVTQALAIVSKPCPAGAA